MLDYLQIVGYNLSAYFLLTYSALKIVLTFTIQTRPQCRSSLHFQHRYRSLHSAFLTSTPPDSRFRSHFPIQARSSSQRSPHMSVPVACPSPLSPRCARLSCKDKLSETFTRSRYGRRSPRGRGGMCRG